MASRSHSAAGASLDARARRCALEILSTVDTDGVIEHGSPADRPSNFSAQLQWTHLLNYTIDRDGKRYVDKGLKYSAPTGPRIEALLLEDPLLLKTPIVRRGTEATVGHHPEVWEGWK